MFSLSHASSLSLFFSFTLEYNVFLNCTSVFDDPQLRKRCTWTQWMKFPRY